MPRHYQKPSAKSKAVKTFDKVMNDLNKPKPIKENNIFENYSDSIKKKDKEKSIKKIKKK